jgi:hypothetical protein
MNQTRISLLKKLSNRTQIESTEKTNLRTELELKPNQILKKL